MYTGAFTCSERTRPAGCYMQKDRKFGLFVDDDLGQKGEKSPQAAGLSV